MKKYLIKMETLKPFDLSHLTHFYESTHSPSIQEQFVKNSLKIFTSQQNSFLTTTIPLLVHHTTM